MLKLDKKYGFCYTEYTNAYEYDCHGQLTGEAFTDAGGKINITEITYDTVGNIRTKSGKLYEYDSTWKDLLVKYDGKNIYYDALGNPTTYLGNVLTWTVGRKLETFGDNISYKYNSLGQRIAKTVGDTVHEYFYEGTRLVKEVRTDSDGTVHTLVFLYDASDSPVGMQYDGSAYYYKKNLQGDVIALLDANCNTVAEYIYDAWGALRTINADTLQHTLLAALNPIRYRGYYYDNETGFYFLQSRYYDPVVGRFLNADDVEYTKLTTDFSVINLYAYCFNDPVNESDQDGTLLFTICKKIVLGLIKGLLKQLCMDIVQYLITYYINGKQDTQLTPNSEDYIASVLSSIFEELGFSGSFECIWIVVKYVPKLIRDGLTKSIIVNVMLDIGEILLKNFFKKSIDEFNDLNKQLKKIKKKLPKHKREAIRIKQSNKLEGIDICEKTIKYVLPVFPAIISVLTNVLLEICD